MIPHDPHHDLLKPREVAEVFGVRTTTIARWAREGRLVPVFTPGGHRRYSRQDVARLLEDNNRLADVNVADAVRLYGAGWSIRRVAQEFNMSYGAMRRILQRNTTLRRKDGSRPAEWP